MPNYRCFLIAGLILSATKLTAQIRQISLSGTYAPIINTINVTEINHTALGIAGEFEYKPRKHWSFGITLDWQKYQNERVLVYPFHPTNPYLIEFFISRNQLNFRPQFRYYWKEQFKGFYVGAFGAFSFLTTTPKTSPQVDGFPHSRIDYAYKSAAGMGLTYGYRFKLTPSFRLSVFGNHQVVLSDLYDDDSAHQDHQLGLGLNWVWGK